MENPWAEPLSKEELKHVAAMTDVEVIFDVGVRSSLDYLEIFPNAEYHLFEPNPPFYKWLQEATKDNPKIHVNPFGLSDKKGILKYNQGSQAFEGGDNNAVTGYEDYPVQTLNHYINENNIPRIDFLKIDTEGYDYKVLAGGSEAIRMARYIQYEHWDDLFKFHDLLSKDFNMNYIGLRNVFCTRRI